MVDKKEGINPTETFTSNLINGERIPDIFMQSCPHCYSEDVTFSRKYETKNNGERSLYICQDCGAYFSETYGTPIADLSTPLSDVARVLKARDGRNGIKCIAKSI